MGITIALFGQAERRFVPPKLPEDQAALDRNLKESMRGSLAKRGRSFSPLYLLKPVDDRDFMSTNLPLALRRAMYNLRGGFLIRPLAIALASGFAGALFSWIEERFPASAAGFPPRSSLRMRIRRRIEF